MSCWLLRPQGSGTCVALTPWDGVYLPVEAESTTLTDHPEADRVQLALDFPAAPASREKVCPALGPGAAGGGTGDGPVFALTEARALCADVECMCVSSTRVTSISNQITRAKMFLLDVKSSFNPRSPPLPHSRRPLAAALACPVPPTALGWAPWMQHGLPEPHPAPGSRGLAPPPRLAAALGGTLSAAGSPVSGGQGAGQPSPRGVEGLRHRSAASPHTQA